MQQKAPVAGGCRFAPPGYKKLPGLHYVYRVLSTLEHMFWLRHAFSHGIEFVVIRLRGRPSECDTRRAFRALAEARHNHGIPNADTLDCRPEAVHVRHVSRDSDSVQEILTASPSGLICGWYPADVNTTTRRTTTIRR